LKNLYSTTINTCYGEKSISVYEGDVMLFPYEIDILVTSAFYRSYLPTPKTLFAALDKAGISVLKMSKDPEIDLRNLCNVWLSKEIQRPLIQIRRIGCIELSEARWRDRNQADNIEQKMLNSIKAYFQMLDIAATYGIKMDTVALPLLGAGNQNIAVSLTMIPVINECISFLKRNGEVKRICFIERNWEKADLIVQTLKESYLVNRQSAERELVIPKVGAAHNMAFISYASPDRNIADNLCARLEQNGIKVWYAPRNVHGDYATAIAEAIGKATHFVVILSKNSMSSQHVLNEIDLAFQGLPDHIRFKPLRIDDTDFAPAFNYYLSRQHWMDAHLPPLEQRLDEYVKDFLADF